MCFAQSTKYSNGIYCTCTWVGTSFKSAKNRENYKRKKSVWRPPASRVGRPRNQPSSSPVNNLLDVYA
ncbi:hypothetical protein E2C01_006387 [Portunus trituberculatus]|uniref:Uncharacterized protein n=1 Tax=Portunus trituberculatus TaxID=210409 RepID=A0A5B7CUZ0_PORTR|nr:hypothetical protein [Portunus trituberculatus]